MDLAYTRQISNQLIDFINDKIQNKHVLLLGGARQVGKTTTLLSLLKDCPHLFLNLEKSKSIITKIDACSDFADFDHYLRDEHKFVPERDVLIIDEAQYSQKLGGFIRFMKEDWQQATVIITGSLISEIYGKNDRTAVGRERHMNLYPMTFSEFLGALGQDSLLNALKKFSLNQELSSSVHARLMEKFDLYLNVGGLPEVVKYFATGRDYKTLRQDIFKSYEDDFIRYFSMDQVNLFRRCLEAVAANAGSPSKDSQAIRPNSPGYKKVADIFARLEKWNLVIKIEQLGSQPEHNKFHPKRYLYDVGVLADLRLKGLQDVSINDISHPVLRTPLGGMIENAVAQAFTVQWGDGVFGIKLSGQSEIDFGIKQNGKVFPVECKASLRFKENYLSPLKTYLDAYTTHSAGFLLYGGPPLAKAQHGIHVLPYYLADEIKRLADQVSNQARSHK